MSGTEALSNFSNGSSQVQVRGMDELRLDGGVNLEEPEQGLALCYENNRVPGSGGGCEQRLYSHLLGFALFHLVSHIRDDSQVNGTRTEGNGCGSRYQQRGNKPSQQFAFAFLGHAVSPLKSLIGLGSPEKLDGR
jgi:hypothetical protein